MLSHQKAFPLVMHSLQFHLQTLRVEPFCPTLNRAKNLFSMVIFVWQSDVTAITETSHIFTLMVFHGGTIDQNSVTIPK